MTTETQHHEMSLPLSRHASLPSGPSQSPSLSQSSSPAHLPFSFPYSFVDADSEPGDAPTPQASTNLCDSLDLPSTSDFDTATLSMLDHLTIRSNPVSEHHPSTQPHSNTNHPHPRLQHELNDPSPSLSAFANLPHYPFDFDYRGHTLRPPLLRAPTLPSPRSTKPPRPASPSAPTLPRPETARQANLRAHGYAGDFESYMFPEVEESASACVSFEDEDDNTVTDTISDENHVNTHKLTHNHHKHQHQPHLNRIHMPHSTRTLSSDQPNDPALARAPRSRPRARSSGHAVRTRNADDTRRRRGDAVDADDAAGEIEQGVIDWDLIRNAQLSFADGTPLPAERLYTGYCNLSILLLLPRESIETCALVYAKVAHLLQQVSTRLVFITPWTPEQASKFLARFERIAPFPGSLVCDPSATLFSAFGLTRSPFQALFATNALSAPSRQGVRNALSAVTYRAANRDIGSTAVPSKRLKAGTVVLKCLRGYSKLPDVVYSQTESIATGVGCYLDVLTVTGVNDAFVPDIDVAQLLTRFNCMRVTSLKARYADMKDSSSSIVIQQNSSRQNHHHNHHHHQLASNTNASDPNIIETNHNHNSDRNRSSRKTDRRNALKT